MLQVSNVSVRYGMVDGIQDVSIRVEAGQIVSLIGANGAGKSTLLNAISGVVPPYGGQILFDGKAIQNLPAEKIVSLGVVQSPEGRQVFAQMSVLENLMMGAYSRRRSFSKAELDEIFELFPRLHERRTQLAGLMSGGEQQMLAIGRALMARPRLLLLDEPSMGLAPLVVKTIFSVLKKLNQTGLSILLVEQNAKAAMRLSDYTYVLVNGQLSREGRSVDLLGDAEINEAFLGRHVNKNEGVCLV